MRKFKTKPLLSISLLASNRKDTTRKCLDSLKPIMEQIRSELVIVDTGCDEEMQSLLREYTDKIIPFTWCNDFSKARNAGLKECRGEWFLVIDDDEWFGDVTELVDFFKSGEYKQYGHALYIQRNYMDRKGIRHQDSWRSGLIRLEKDTRYVSRVHEYLYPVHGKCKIIHSYVHHYGYIFKTRKDKYEHAQRNISLLLDMLEKERGNLRWWGQLAQEYKGIPEYRKLEDLCREGLQSFQNVNDPHVNCQRGIFYGGCLSAELNTFRFEAVIKDYEKFIADKRNTKVCQAKLHSFAAEAYLNLKDYEKAQECCRLYAEICDEIGDNEQVILEEGAFFTGDAFIEEMRNTVYSVYIISSLKQGEIALAKKYFYKLGWKDKILNTFEGTVESLITAFARHPYEEDFVSMAQQILDRKGPDAEAIEAAQKIEKQEKEEGDGEGEQGDFLRLARVFSQVKSPHWYIWYLKARYADASGDGELLLESYKKLFACVADIFQLDESIWDAAIRNKVDLESLFFTVPFDQWKTGVDSFLETAELDTVRQRAEVVETGRKQENIRYDYFFLKKMEVELVRGGEEEDASALKAQLLEFSEKSIAFYGRFFKKTAFSGEMELLPKSLRFAVTLKKAMEKEEGREFKAVVSIYKKCLEIFPPMDHVVKHYVKLLGEREKERRTKELEERQEEFLKISGCQEEMEELAREVKKQMAYLAGAGMEKEAAEVYGQLKKLVPNDPELESFAYLEA